MGEIRGLAASLGMPALLATPPREPRDRVLPPSRLEAAARAALMALAELRDDDESRAMHTPAAALADQLRIRAGDLSGAPDAVLVPRDEEAVVAILKECAARDVAAGGGAHPWVALDLGALNQATLLEDGLVAMGATPACDPQEVHALRLATPQGLLTAEGDLARVMAGMPGGVITGITMPVRAPAKLRQTYLFADFAAGLAAMQRAPGGLRLWDQWGFLRKLAEPARGVKAWLDDYRTRRFNEDAAVLVAEFPDSAAQKQFEAQNKNGLRTREPMPPLRDSLLDHGAALDTAQVWANWSKLTALRDAVRTSLEQAMRDHAPRDGAHGLVLTQIGRAGPHGATVRFTWLFARRLEEEIAQATAIRQAALVALAPPDNALEAEIRRAITRTIDPKGIMR